MIITFQKKTSTLQKIIYQIVTIRQVGWAINAQLTPLELIKIYALLTQFLS
jgi:hypothetical protein